MSKGTTEVQKALGNDASRVTVAQIQEALWHYYYDVDKSVGYLRRTFISPVQKPVKKTPEGKSGDFSFSDRLGMFVMASAVDQGRPVRSAVYQDGHGSLGHPYLSAHTLLESRYSSPTESFGDMPWLNVPRDRLAHLVPPLRPRGGLLGGGEGPVKVSKLQALAAARKKKTEEKKEQDKASEAETGMKRLSLSGHATKQSMSVSPSPAKRQKSSEKQALRPILRSSVPPDGSPSHPEELGEPGKVYNAGKGNHKGESVAKPNPTIPSVDDDQVVMTAFNAAPSAFARTLLGSAPECRQTNRPDSFAMPYATSPAFLATAFSEPSPDDIVLAAQAKGSNFALAK